MSEQKVIPQPYTALTYFVSSLNTFFGHHLIPRLRNQNIHPDNPNRILGTTVPASAYAVPKGVRKVIETQKVKFFEEVLLNSHVIIYDLSTCDLKQAQFVISTLKMHPFAQEKILICVSNVMTWAKTKPKEKKEGQEQDADQNPIEQPDSQQQNAGEEEKKTYVRYTDRDYVQRRAHLQYQQMKSIQTLCLAAGKCKANLKTYVVCSGLIYGQGQQLFKQYFMQARQQQPPKLPYYGRGKNRIPCIHICDLITYIEKIIVKRPSIAYVLALDHNPKCTQRKIIQSISKGIGTGSVQSLPGGNDFLTLNLRLKPTMIFVKMQEEQAGQEQEQGNQREKFKFGWRAREGIQKNIESLRKEYNGVHGLAQEKVFVVGPPGSGKTFHAARIAKKYYLPHIHIRGVIEAVKELQNQLGQQIRAYFVQKKQAEVSARQTQYEQMVERMNKIPKEYRDEIEPFDPESVDVRLSDELLYKCYRWRLSQNDCLNRGYVLDGYPKKYADAKELFMWVPPTENEEENQKKVLDQRVIPDKLIILEMSDGEIIGRLQTLSEQIISKTHFSEKKIKRLLQRYRVMNDPTTGQYIIEDFFRENNKKIYHIAVSGQTETLIQSLIKPLQLDEGRERKVVEEKLGQEKREKDKVRTEMDMKQTIIRNIQNEDYRMKKQNEQNEERQILDKKSLALRKYLDVNLVPILSQGIVEILKTCPANPVDALAQFLFKNSLKVPNPDPSTFDF